MQVNEVILPDHFQPHLTICVEYATLLPRVLLANTDFNNYMKEHCMRTFHGRPQGGGGQE